MRVVALFPGQGSQKPGMGRALAEAFPAARAVFDRIDAALHAPIRTLCFEGPADALTATENAQPALYAHGAAVWSVVRDAVMPHLAAAAGHSLGEHTAYHAAGAVALEDGACMVRRRGEIMSEIGAGRPGTMAAVLGALGRPIDAICAEATREAGLVVPANYNADEQTVISGEIAGVERALELARAAGARRAMRLQVSGAFHSPLMAPAEIALAGAIGATPFADPAVPVYANVTAEPVLRAADARAMLLRQLTAPVRWVELIRNIDAAFPEALYVELGPGSVLSGLVSRILPGARTVACGEPAQVDLLHEALR